MDLPPERVRINHVDAGDAMRLDGRVPGKVDRSYSVEVVEQLHK